ncbi:hypothetical protein SteCoe_1746 [Stentor coeruleus]|uniref:Hexose transporter 1 n=1 Tax=Stentor coeruleus TaxID=5963 RepID=A0A1R2D1C1_9CILI|nr:hypothetical protein SteCoe_1746 [Stentor coeruleus]
MASFKSSREYSVNSADFEKSSVVITEKEYNLKFLICISWTVTISSFVMGIYYLGYEIGVLNISELHIMHYYDWKGENKSRYITLANVLLCFGGTIGAYASGRISNWLGRRKTLIRTNLLYYAAIGISIIPYDAFFFVGRAVIGICVGIFSVIPPIFISEVAPKEIKGFLGTFIQIGISLGILFTFLLSFIAERYLENYRLIVLLFTVPVSVTLLQMYLFYTKYDLDTPIWLLGSDRVTETEMILKKIYKPWSWQGRYSAMEPDKVIKDMKKSNPVLSLPGRPQNLITLSIILSIIQQASGVNAIIFYSKEMLKKSQTFQTEAATFTVIIGILNFIMVIPTMFLIEKIGRKKLLLQGLAGMCFSYALFGLLSSLWFESKNEKEMVLFAGLLSAIAFYETSLGPVFWVYITEILTKMWVGPAITVHWIMAMIVTGTFEILCNGDMNVDIVYYFSVCGLCCLIGFIFVYKLAIESVCPYGLSHITLSTPL